MKNKSPEAQRQEAAFTLIELLVVIAIIGTLAALLLPTLGKVKTRAKETMARADMGNLNGCISAFYGENNSLPASTNASAAAGYMSSKSALGGDFTFGTLVLGTKANGGAGSPLEGQQIVASSVISQPVTTPETGYSTPYQNVNSEVIAILTDAAYYPETGHAYNPQKTPFYNGRPAPDTNSPGIDANNILRDPWGLPYMITLDLNYDGKCIDPIWFGTFNVTVPGSSMIWSFGQLRTIALNQPANGPINKHLLTSWK